MTHPRVDQDPPGPAQRFIVAQSWWIASELVRRHPELVIHEMHPGGGHYDVLAIFAPPYADARAIVMLNRAGTLQVHVRDESGGTPDLRVVGTWADVLSASNPHGFAKVIESAAGLPIVPKAPPSTPRTLAYRFIATLLTMTVNDRNTWDARNEFIDSSGDGWPGEAELRGHLDSFPDTRRDFSSITALGLWHEPESHFWAVMKDQIPVAIVSLEGHVYRSDRRYSLTEEYTAMGRRMFPVVASILNGLQP